jgi:adenylate kinase family enzyme
MFAMLINKALLPSSRRNAQLRGSMNKVVILGRGGAGKSTFAARLGAATGLPVIELDEHFWPADLTPVSRDQWTAVQRQLVDAERWILDGDLGPYDALEVRLAAADTIIILDFPLWLCAWRAARRSRENPAFWRWLLGYRRRSLPTVVAAIADHAQAADIHLLRSPREADQLLLRRDVLGRGFDRVRATGRPGRRCRPGAR